MVSLRVVEIQPTLATSWRQIPQLLVSKGWARPRDDKYAQLLPVSDPVYAVYAEKAGGSAARRPRPKPQLESELGLSPEEVERNKQRIRETLSCPYCGNRLKRWMVPDNPFGQTWDTEYMYICFHDACPYFAQGGSTCSSSITGALPIA